MEFVKAQLAGAETDLTSLILAPHVLHRKPMTLPVGTKFAVLEGAGASGSAGAGRTAS